MVRLIRWMLGLCNHQYSTFEKSEVLYTGKEGDVQDIDLAMRGAVKGHLYKQACTRPGCMHIRHKYIKEPK